MTASTTEHARERAYSLEHGGPTLEERVVAVREALNELEADLRQRS